MTDHILSLTLRELFIDKLRPLTEGHVTLTITITVSHYVVLIQYCIQSHMKELPLLHF